MLVGSGAREGSPAEDFPEPRQWEPLQIAERNMTRVTGVGLAHERTDKNQNQTRHG